MKNWLFLVCALGLFAGAAYAQDAAPPADTSNARAACKADYQKLCQGVRPGGGRAVACLNDHMDQLSPICKDAMQKRAAQQGNGSAPPSSADTPSKPPQQRSDF
jgi:Cysteine rich repeat